MVIRFERVTYRYAGAPRNAAPALRDVALSIDGPRFVAVLGSPGSGKSTLLQHFNGIERPTEGVVRVLDYSIAHGEKLKSANELRRRVGLVFQYPERQLFESTVEEDICFGPRNFGMSQGEAKAAARAVCEWIGLDPALLPFSPFALSGGEQRLAAVAAVLAVDPDIVALDEPTASLDPASREELLRRLRSLVDERGKTIVVVSHRLEEVIRVADDFVVMEGGAIVFHGGAAELLEREELIERAGASLPAAVRLMRRFAAAFDVEPPAGAPSAEEAAEFVRRTLEARGFRSKEGVGAHA
ncbi:ATP-binding cassette domain-containing protein [Paenibacillus antri]|uniref:ATP-binding cassette domain-containing protein n=1 Tax=Paenibacillus antri TaxID=2582848 RepID=A0A5R9G6J3_9BACL|nr:ATP-binding cassette domain-containing protein [Paenibacillus antri]TLS48574.1 ATP-binding cassette domain-containing protein [Paenibacillus antri]